MEMEVSRHRLVSLNVWGGNTQTVLRLFRFMGGMSSVVEIFALQEVYSTLCDPVDIPGYVPNERVYPSLLQELCAELPRFSPIFHAQAYNHDYKGPVAGHLAFGKVMLVHESNHIVNCGDCIVSPESNLAPPSPSIPGPATMQYITIQNGLNKLTVFNIHGLWQLHKEDSPERIEQSRRISQIIRQVQGEVILCGDFNLSPDTQSMEIIESSRLGMRNLITEARVTTTRNHFFQGNTFHADYILVSRGVKVHTFAVLLDIVSDHQPLFLEFSFW